MARAIGLKRAMGTWLPGNGWPVTGSRIVTETPEKSPRRHDSGATLLTSGDYYMHLADLKDYLAADKNLTDLYARSDDWARTAILNIAGAGKFSSDRTIAQYASEIWSAAPCPVSSDPALSP